MNDEPSFMLLCQYGLEPEMLAVSAVSAKATTPRPRGERKGADSVFWIHLLERDVIPEQWMNVKLAAEWQPVRPSLIDRHLDKIPQEWWAGGDDIPRKFGMWPSILKGKKAK